MLATTLALLIPAATADLGPVPECPPGTYDQYLWGHNCVHRGYRMVGTRAGKFEVRESTAEAIDALQRQADALPENAPAEERARLHDAVTALVRADAAEAPPPARESARTNMGRVAPPPAAPSMPAPPQPEPSAPPNAGAAPAATTDGCNAAAGRAGAVWLIAAACAALGRARRPRR